MNNPLLSIIIISHNGIISPKTLSSIVSSSYRDKEIFVLCPKESEKKIRRKGRGLAEINIIPYDRNRDLQSPLFVAIDLSHGDYISLLDEDISVSVDFYRLLLEKASLSGADIVFGDVSAWNGRSYSYRNFSYVRNVALDLRESECIDFYMNTMGLEPELYALGNKIYKKDLLLKCKPYGSNIPDLCSVLGMMQFSALLFFFAKAVVNIHNEYACYNHCLTVAEKRECQNAFTQIQQMLLPLMEKDEKLTFPVWRDDAFDREKAYLFSSSNYTEFKDNHSDALKQRILDKRIRIVSFDVFDTLVVRPFYYPTDLFYLLDVFVNNLIGSTDKIDFKKIRIESECLARNKIAMSECEDVTLDRIYDIIRELTGFPAEWLNATKAEEIRLELKYCRCRLYAKELYELALYCGKQIIITSDMYLPESVIVRILTSCGYKDWYAVYVSNNQRFTKASSHLYRHIAEVICSSPDAILHIGDNFSTDVVNARRAGWNAEYLPRTIDIAKGDAGGFYGGDVISRCFCQSFCLRGPNEFEKYFGLRCLLAVVANKLFDNPFIPFNVETNFNCAPDIIGYFPLGMHIFALAHWLQEEMHAGKYKNINFMARDGYVPMEAFSILAKVYGDDVSCRYLHLSRRTVLPLQIQKPEDLYGLEVNINIFANSPKTLVNLLSNIIEPSVLEDAEYICTSAGFVYDKFFSSSGEFYKFISFFKENLYSQKMIAKCKRLFEAYLLPSFKGRSATFDIGYSCRIESVLKSVLGYDVTPFYVYTTTDLPLYRALKHGLAIHCFYQYWPGISGLERELVISNTEGPLAALKNDNGVLREVFAKAENDGTGAYLVKVMQDNALLFVRDMVAIFDADIKFLLYDRDYASFPYELLLLSPAARDLYLFSVLVVENRLDSLKNSARFTDEWGAHIKQMHAADVHYDAACPHLIKWSYLFFVDRAAFKSGIKRRLAKRPVFLAVLKTIYRKAKKIKRKLAAL